MVANDLYMRCPELIAPITAYTTQYSSIYASSDALVNYWIGLMPQYFNAGRWGGYLLDGMIWRVAHEIAQQIKFNEDSDIAVDGLGINRVRIGSENTNTRNLAVSEANKPFMATKYGQRYLLLIRQLGVVALAL